MASSEVGWAAEGSSLQRPPEAAQCSPSPTRCYYLLTVNIALILPSLVALQSLLPLSSQLPQPLLLVSWGTIAVALQSSVFFA